jgi:hypothetical protein
MRGMALACGRGALLGATSSTPSPPRARRARGHGVVARRGPCALPPPRRGLSARPWRGPAPWRACPLATRRAAVAPAARRSSRPGARPPAPVTAQRGTPAQRGPGPARLRLARSWCPCVARRVCGSAPACVRLIRGASARPCAFTCSRGARSALARLAVPSA